MLTRTRCLPLLAAVLFALSSANAATTVPDAQIDAMTASLRAAPVSFDVHLPSRDQAALDALLADIQDPLSPQYHKWLSAAEFQRRFGPAPAQLAQVRAALQAAHMTVVQQGPTLHVSATADSVERLFAAPLVADLKAGQQVRLAAAAPLQLPAALRANGVTVTGLSRGLPAAHMNSRVLAGDPSNRYGEGSTSYWYNDLKQAYGYPSYQTMIGAPGKQQRLDGSGSTIAILIGSDVLDTDIAAMFDHEHFSRYAGNHANPTLYARRYVAGAKPGVQDGNLAAEREATLDVDMALGGAPGAHVLLYVLPDLTIDSLLAGYRQIVQDNQADVVSSSFGLCEQYFTPAYNSGRDATFIAGLFDAVFKQGNAQGITFVASSGDNAGLECPDTQYLVDGKNGRYIPSVEWPAADAHVTAVGGGNLFTAYKKGSLGSGYVSESAYADPLQADDPYGVGALLTGGYWGAGGGVSTLFQRPGYQLRALGGTRTSMRALPDVGMLVGGCPSIAVQPCQQEGSAVSIYVAGAITKVIGTSVAAPEFASVAALLVQKQGRQGNLNDYLYRLAANGPEAYHRGIPGNNGVVSNDVPIAGKYNYTTGLGTPIVRLMIGALDAAPAGIPRSPSNP
ncbi:TPA: S8/S53 family peptidase [Xanthomonas vasicola pv. zeae]|uniref:Peptidase S53 n=4 Tax=Xanthomonas vasicola TaxID=56459 RepID=A0AAE8F7T3_XANVA|nr:S53 family peptidase [Xanthomonas vasicola]AVQ05731.1 peptidase S53 [Xanthomonas vasicola pv. vasculorum]KEZ95389.1 peptidase S53 [Xanthomonas vasicola pv. vasculorum NCPPB 895]KFA22291.1 peptidase S53 [Xanthomonas vasicola pv. vasculorum NCPPB 1326]KFA32305.1 peptidase S53 [Xanthomonas vasicola pv. vasculorum NCPPB 1381]KFA32893.1 peptidase S53 [Xanthomonas vasicola pv. vasculorum NCPPB 206]